MLLAQNLTPVNWRMLVDGNIFFLTEKEGKSKNHGLIALPYIIECFTYLSRT